MGNLYAEPIAVTILSSNFSTSREIHGSSLFEATFSDGYTESGSVSLNDSVSHRVGANNHKNDISQSILSVYAYVQNSTGDIHESA